MFRVERAETSAEEAIANRHQWPVSLSVFYTEDDTDAKVFVMHASPDPDVFADSLSCVASAIQMTDLPEDAPAEGSPFYRVSEVTKLCRSAAAAEEFFDKVVYAIGDLADNLASAEALSSAETIIITPTYDA